VFVEKIRDRDKENILIVGVAAPIFLLITPLNGYNNGCPADLILGWGAF